jgi:hypothetical protein
VEIFYIRGSVPDFITVDATLRENHAGSASATEHPVERGVDLTDHVHNDRDRLSAEVHISNTPIVSPEDDGAFGAVSPVSVETQRRRLVRGAKSDEDAEYELETGTINANVLQFPTDFDRVRSVYEKFLRVKKEALTLTITTPLRVYENMLLIDVSAPRDATTGDAITLTLEFVQISFADSETVDEPVPLETRAEREARRGPQGTEEEDEDSEIATVLFNI